MSWLLVPLCLPLEMVASQQGQYSLSPSPLHVSKRHLRSRCLVWNKPLHAVSSVTQSTKLLPVGIGKQGRRDAACLHASLYSAITSSVFTSSRRKKKLCVFLGAKFFFTNLSFPLGLQAFPGSCCSFCRYQPYEYAQLIFTHSSVCTLDFKS